MRKFWKEFKEFINKGNVLGLAVGVIIGGAFSTITTSLTNDIIMPVVSIFLGGVDFSSMSITLPTFYPLAEDAAPGETNLQAQLWRLRRVPKEDGDTHIEIFLGLYLPGRKNRERDLYDDDVLLGGAGRDDG